MTTVERSHLVAVLSRDRETIAASWERAVAHTGYVPLSSSQLRDRLTAWVDQLMSLFCAEPLDTATVQGIGGALGRLYYGHPDTLSRTLEALGEGFTLRLTPEQRAELQPSLLALLGQLAAGYLGQTRQIVLAEQETTRNALLRARQQMEEALRESEARFRALFESAAIGIGIGDMDGRILETNPALQALLGYPADEIRNRRVAEFMHPDDLHSVWAMYQELVSGQRDYFQLEKPFYRKDGHSLWTHLTVSLVRGAEGQPLLQIAMIENVTERKQAEETIKQLNADLERRVLDRTAQLSALNEELADEIARRAAVEGERVQLLARAQAARADAEAAQQRLAFLAEASTVLALSLDYKTTLASVARLAVPHLADWCAVDVVDQGGLIQRLAVAHVDLAKVEAVRSLNGHYPPLSDALSGVAQVLETGRPEFWPVIPETLAARVSADEALNRLYARLEPRARMTVPLLAGARTLGSITFVRSESGLTYSRDDLALAEDLARRAALAIDNARLYQEAQDALATRNEFLSVAAHELKTPITSLRGFAQLTLRVLDTGELDRQRLVSALRIVDAQSEKLTRLVAQLLDVSRIDSGRLALNCREIDLREVIADVVTNLEPRSDHHTLALFAPAPVPVSADPLRIEQVMVNLLDNAMKFSPQGGTIEVELAISDSQTARIAVRDRGIGIPPQHRKRLFERFYQAEAAGTHAAGMGLGLYISRQIVELHGGHIAAEFPEDGGTRFVVTLPIGAERP